MPGQRPQPLTPAPRIESLVLVHALDAGSEAAAAQRLDELVAGGPLLVVQRDAFLLPGIAQRLAGCEQLAEAATAQLYRCAPAGRPASSARAAVLP